MLRAGGIEKGGAAVVVTTGSARNPIVLEEIIKKGRRYTCSYDEEKSAMNIAMDWLMENNTSTDAAICTDSLSLLMAIERMSSDTAEIRNKLCKLKGKITIQWTPGHVNVPGNELADQAAKKAAQEEEHESIPCPVTYHSAVAMIKREIKDRPPQHPTVSKTYEHISLKTDHTIKSRKDATLLAQLRTGHCNKLAAYQHRIDEQKSDICPRCDLEPETVKHWITCPATIQKRMTTFGTADVPLGALTKTPDKALAFAKATLLG